MPRCVTVLGADSDVAQRRGGAVDRLPGEGDVKHGAAERRARPAGPRPRNRSRARRVDAACATATRSTEVPAALASASRKASYPPLPMPTQSTAHSTIGASSPNSTRPRTESGSTISLAGGTAASHSGLPKGGVASHLKRADRQRFGRRRSCQATGRQAPQARKRQVDGAWRQPPK